MFGNSQTDVSSSILRRVQHRRGEAVDRVFDATGPAPRVRPGGPSTNVSRPPLMGMPSAYNVSVRSAPKAFLHEHSSRILGWRPGSGAHAYDRRWKARFQRCRRTSESTCWQYSSTSKAHSRRRALAQPNSAASSQGAAGRNNGQQLINPTPQANVMRALLRALHQWAADGTPPPASQYPRLGNKTLRPSGTPSSCAAGHFLRSTTQTSDQRIIGGR